jgi:glycine/D-amino acid oxidase-like deaminating enzyme
MACAASPQAPSFWLHAMGARRQRGSLEANSRIDVAIVGGGLSGLYLAYYLKKASPALKIAIFEERYVGYGASGRNGGWASALVPFDKARLERDVSLYEAQRIDKAMVEGVYEIARVIQEEEIDCDFHLGGTLILARNEAHKRRLQSYVQQENRYRSEPRHRWLDRDEVELRLRGTDSLGAAFDEVCARVHPAKLVYGLAKAVERLGVQIYEGTKVSKISKGELMTDAGYRVKAMHVLQCTEAFNAGIDSPLKASIVPIYSLMIVTEPLDDRFFDEVGWSGFETVSDGRGLIIYLQRTADNRVAIGGRGAPYLFRGTLSDEAETNPKVKAALVDALLDLFPYLKEVKVAYEWGGAIAMTRDLTPNIFYDHDLGYGATFGYGGDGVTMTNVAGRTLCDLVLAKQNELTSLCWVGHRSRPWEPEPLRYLGINSSILLARMIDAKESEGKDANGLRRVFSLLVPK